VKRLTVPLPREEALRLRAGDSVLLSGRILTARDRAHRFLLKEDFRKARGAAIYHCGPVIKDGAVIAAGPTTSSRMNQYTPALIEKYGISAIIGKGGMDGKVLESMRDRCVYLSAIGGAAVTYADSMKLVGVDREDFGMPEAIWEFQVRDFPAIVTMDAHGNSIHAKVLEESEKRLRGLLY